MWTSTVWCNGCFDVLHVGHVRLLAYARKLGGRVVVGIDSDKRVRASKGSGRPVNNEEDRRSVLESIRHVDAVYIFDSDEELENLIKEIRPEYMLIGSDYKDKPVIGSQYSEVVFFERIPGYSTTSILEKGK